MNPRTAKLMLLVLSGSMLRAAATAQDANDIEAGIASFSAEYDISVAFATLPTTSDLSLVRVDDNADGRRMTETFWRLLEPEVRKYPVALLRKANIETFALVRSGRHGVTEFTGLAYPSLRTVFFSMQSLAGSDRATLVRKKLVIHHEIYHMLDWALFAKDLPRISDEWSALNAPGITYKPGPLDFDTSGKIPGFLFGHTGPNAREDMADTFAFLMVGSSYATIEKRLGSDARLKAKFDYLKRLVRSAVPEFTDDYIAGMQAGEASERAFGEATRSETIERLPRESIRNNRAERRASGHDGPSPIVLDGWGRLIDPDCDCGVKTEPGTCTITVPGRLHDLNPRSGRLNAPRILRPVEGDFVAQVQVSGAFEPGQNSTSPHSVPFVGAGLLVWADERNYMRLERNRYLVRGTPACYPPLFEVYQDGRYQGTSPPPTTGSFFASRSTHFRLERKGDRIAAHYSHDGKDWTALREVVVALPAGVRVGVAAINTSDKPLEVQFSGFVLRAGKQAAPASVGERAQ